MGGSASEEFLAPTPSGEDTFVQCSTCDYAANTEAVEVAPAAPDTRVHPTMRVVPIPGTPTIATLVDRLNEMGEGRTWTAADTLKNVVLRTRDPGGDAWSLLVIGVPGDRDVDLKRVEAQLHPAEVEPARPEDLAAAGLVMGYIGPAGVAAAGVRYLVDPSVADGSAWVTGADRDGHHAYDVVRGRDFTPDGTIGAVEIRDGEPCVRCGSPLHVARGIELGHVFQLGRKFADAYELDVAGPDGKPVRVTMGSYGVGVSRAVAALAEQTCDDSGLVWPASVAPAQVHVVVAGKDDELHDAAGRLADEMVAAGLTVMLDDRRAVSAGVKFKDAELIGVPTIVTVGRKLAEGLVEVRRRAGDVRTEVAVGEVAGEVAAGLAAAIGAGPAAGMAGTGVA
jgi:prolyl-tRNA synthetase